MNSDAPRRSSATVVASTTARSHGPAACRPTCHAACKSCMRPTWPPTSAFTSCLAFQMRRVDVLIDAGARENFQVAELERQLALKAWQELAGNVDVNDALARRIEIERLARHLVALDASTDVVDVLRGELEE